MKKKILLTTILLLVLLANISFASYKTVTMSVVEEPICSITIGENSKFEKKLISKDLNNKEVTLRLQVTNEEVAQKPTGEIMIVLDNSNSMTLNTLEGSIRKDLVFGSAKTLVSNLMKDNSNLKIGLVSFSTNADSTKEGTLEDAKLETGLTNDLTQLLQKIDTIETSGLRTNLESGLSLASTQFTKSNHNKYMIVLTDGVPNVAINYEPPYYSDDVIQKTKTQLLNLKQNNIQLITMLTGIDTADSVPAGVTKTYGQIITEIFGTEQNPTAGHFYYITDDKIETTITDDIYQSLLPEQKSYRDITIVDYFPKEIIDNFDFAYVTEANIGNISSTVDSSNRSITWTIPELASGQTATVQYKLKLKENFNNSIVDKILRTNEKVDMTYKDFDGKEQVKTSDISPKLKLAEPPAVLPKAGTTTFLIIGFIVAAGLFIYSFTKLVIFNKKTK